MYLTIEWDTCRTHPRTQADCCLVEQSRGPSITGGTFSLTAVSRETAGDAATLWNPTCIDLLIEPALRSTDVEAVQVDDNNSPDYVNLLRGAFGDTISKEPCGGFCPASHPLCSSGTCVVPTCAAIGPEHCQLSTPAGVRARQLCPVTCGCDDPTSPLVLSLPTSGCSEHCTRVAKYSEALAKQPCQDLVPRKEGAFKDFLDTIGTVAPSWPSSWSDSMMKSFVPMLRSYGCSLVAYMREVDASGIDFCTAGRTYYPIKAFSYFCPISCRCRPGIAHCPGTCFGNESVAFPPGLGPNDVATVSNHSAAHDCNAVPPYCSFCTQFAHCATVPDDACVTAPAYCWTECINYAHC
jgi:hypothetical protein